MLLRQNFFPLYEGEDSPRSYPLAALDPLYPWPPSAMHPGNNSRQGATRQSNHSCLFNLATCPGCHGVSSSDLGDPEITEETFHTYFSRFESSNRDEGYNRHLAGRAIIEPDLLGTNELIINRDLMKEEFYRVHFPAGLVGEDTDFMYSHFLPRELLQDMGPSMDAAVDALCLVQLGISRSDVSLINQARRRHQVAVSNLQLDLIGDTAIYDDHVLGAVYLLGICEMFRALSTVGQYQRAYHTRLSSMLQMRGPGGHYSKFAQIVVYGFRQLATIRGLVERKQVPFSGRAWKNCAALTTGVMAELGEQLIQIPGALERADRVMNQTRTSSQDILDAMIELATIERDMQTWIVQFYSTFDSLPFWPENVNNFPDFSRYTSGAPPVFPKALVYPSFSHASAQAFYWIGLLQVKRTMLMLNRQRTGSFLPKPESTMITEATECAEKLCESIAYLVQPRHGLCGNLGAASPLYYASCWFVKQGATQNVAWCDIVRKSNRDQTGIVQMMPDR